MPRFLLNIACLVVMVLPTTLPAETLTLKECLESGSRNNPTLSIIRQERAIARTNVRQADSALYPRIDTQGGFTMQQEAQAVQINGRSAETQQADFGFVSTSLNYTIYDFGRRDARQQIARAGAEAAGDNVIAREQDIALQIIGTYFGILEAQRLVKDAEEEVAQVTQHKSIAETLYQQGVVTRNDVLQAEVRLASARQKLLVTENRRENLWLQMNYLTGAEPSHRAELDEGADLALSETFAAERNRALANRPELFALRKALEASDYEVAERRSSFFPELFTRLGVDYVQNDKVREQTILSATIGLKLNIFDGFATSAHRQLALQGRAKAADTLRQAEAQIGLELATAINDARIARERIAVTQTSIRQSDENLRINRDRYQARVGTATEVLDAQTLLTQAKTEHYQALYDFQTASARVKRAMGDL